jgi:hypothetical protein
MGMFDSDGTITGVTKSIPQLTIKITNNVKENVEYLHSALGGVKYQEKTGHH